MFPLLGLATLVAYLDKNDEIDLQDQHVEKLNLDDDTDLVIIQVYIANSSIGNQIDNRCRSHGIKIDVTISGNYAMLCQKI